MKEILLLSFDEISKTDIELVGGKNASLGEMIRVFKNKGIPVPDGFSLTCQAFSLFLDTPGLRAKINEHLDQINRITWENVEAQAQKIKTLVSATELPLAILNVLNEGYTSLCSRQNDMDLFVAVRSSATAEDLPSASFAGQHDSFLNVHGLKGIYNAVIQCYASLYNSRAIRYRHINQIKDIDVLLSVGIQQMVRSDTASSGVSFTLDPDTGFKQIVVIDAIWGMGENLVKGIVNPDEYQVFKPILTGQKRSIISKKIGSKSTSLVYNSQTDENENELTPIELQNSWVLTDDEIRTIADWSIRIEEHYGLPMDIEWAKDGPSQKLYILQARPVTVYAHENIKLPKKTSIIKKGPMLAQGKGVGNGIVTGVARLLHSPKDAKMLRAGEILVAEMTSPDWNPILKNAKAILTERGGRTSHAAIVAREQGLLAIVGIGNAIAKIQDGQEITIDTTQGRIGFIYDGKAEWMEDSITQIPDRLPRTSVKLILSDPESAYQYSFYPNEGVGLMRLEFVISDHIRIHPLALMQFETIKNVDIRREIESITVGYPDKRLFFVETLAQSIAMMAAAFYPKPVIVRFSDFKSNEYAQLLGGNEFEPKEENPMIGFRGASRYYNERYIDGFEMECLALKKVRNEHGFFNVKVMVPFCRTIWEGKKVIELMEKNGLKRGENELQVFVMAEIPSNVLLAREFAKIFDGFSIGSNDLTQLTLGIDRDSELVEDLYDEGNPAVKKMIQLLLMQAHESGVTVGFCGQAPSDYPEYASFLIKNSIDSISFTPDALFGGIKHMLQAEKEELTVVI
jgi:pyruvate,water dikinase